MKAFSSLNGSQKLNFRAMALLIAVLSSSFVVLSSLSNVYGVETYSKNTPPFNIPTDVWLSKWWTWWATTTLDEATPKPGGCLMNNSSSMVMLMETTVNGKPQQVCEISSNQGIIVPMWTAFQEDSIPDYHGYSYDQLSKAAKRLFDLGAVTSIVKVDGSPIAKLDVESSAGSGPLDTVTKVNSMDNVTEVYSKGFNITIPENTHMADQNIGTWRSGAHGWFVFIKPLPPGDHTLYYNVGVTGTGDNDHAAEITYDLKVK
jgi:hypothetical protein